MTKKKKGHVELLWTCPNCNGVNPGSVKICGNCGSPQPENVEFYQGNRQVLIKDQEKLAQAKAGADIHCGYCGTRNPAGAKICSQCKSDLSEGKSRKAGGVVGAFKTGPVGEVKCPNCGTMNPDTALKCSQCGTSLNTRKSTQDEKKKASAKTKDKPKSKMGLIIGIVLALACAVFGIYSFLAGRTSTVSGTVSGVSWERSIDIEALGPVSYSDWHDEVPAEGVVESCSEDVRYTEEEPVAGAVEVCGTPYTVDTGGGFGEVQQDCEYQVYEDYCSYTLEEWSVVEEVATDGSDLSAVWPEPELEDGQRIGEEREESYTIQFDVGGESYSYTLDDFSEFQQFENGSLWNLDINTFDNVVSAGR